LAGFEVTLYGRFWVTPEVHLPQGGERNCGFTFVVLPEVAHLAPGERPDLVNPVIEKFLDPNV